MDADQRRRTEDRLLLVEALVTANDRFDEVSAVIAGAEDDEGAARQFVVLLDLPAPHLADAVLDMQLRRRTAANRGRLVRERDELRAVLRRA